MRQIAPEQLYLHYVADGIEFFLQKNGFKTHAIMLSQIDEKQIPFDVAFPAYKDLKILLFGLQIKRPIYRQSKDPMITIWDISKPKGQFEKLYDEFGDWIWYCFPFYRFEQLNDQKPSDILWYTFFVSPFSIPLCTSSIVSDLERLYSRCRTPNNCHYHIHHHHRNTIHMHMFTRSRRCYGVEIYLDASFSCRNYKHESLKRAFRDKRRPLNPIVSLLGYDSWGSLYTKLLLNYTTGTPQVGKIIKSKEELKQLLGTIREPNILNYIILILLDIANKNSIIASFPGIDLTDIDYDDWPYFD